MQLKKPKPTSTEIKQLLKRKVEERKLAATPPPPQPPTVKKENDKLARRRPEPAKVPRKSAAQRQKAQEQVKVPGTIEAPLTPVDEPHNSPFNNLQSYLSEENATPHSHSSNVTPVKSTPLPPPAEVRSPSIEMVSPVPSSSTEDNVAPSPINPPQLYQYPSQTTHYVEPQQAIHPISISYTGNDPVLKNIPNTMIIPMVLDQSYDPAPEAFDEGTRESMYSNEVNDEGEDGVNFLNSMFAGISNQNSNDYSSTDDDEEEGDDFDYGDGGDDYYENSRGVEYTIHEIDETKPARPIILEEKILADNEKFSADWVDKIVKTEVKTEPTDYNFYQHHEHHGSHDHNASSSRRIEIRKEEVIGRFVFFCRVKKRESIFNYSH